MVDENRVDEEIQAIRLRAGRAQTLCFAFLDGGVEAVVAKLNEFLEADGDTERVRVLDDWAAELADQSTVGSVPLLEWAADVTIGEQVRAHVNAGRDPMEQFTAVDAKRILRVATKLCEAFIPLIAVADNAATLLTTPAMRSVDSEVG